MLPLPVTLPGFSSIVAFISDSRRPALSQLLAERSLLKSEALQFAATTDELTRAVTSGSLVLIEGSRLAELAAAGHVREGTSAAGEPRTLEVGAVIEGALTRLPVATRGALRQALGQPRAWSVKRLAHAAGVSPRQLVRQFRRAGFALPPKDVLLAARLASAHALLRGARVPSSTELARECGWVDVRSLRAALRSAGLTSLVGLASVADGAATVSDLAVLLGARST